MDYEGPVYVHCELVFVGERRVNIEDQPWDGVEIKEKQEKADEVVVAFGFHFVVLPYQGVFYIG